ncbi:Transposable element Tcb2 transposase [Ceratobasidium sp. AG-Ba]|nr:Transposable element Tcb2 transposase [Ceratobasidium sp. AG-Ba]
MARNTSPATKARIVTMIERGAKSYAEVGRAVKRDPTTVSRIYKRYHKSHNFTAVGSRSGRPRKLTKYDGKLAAYSLARGTAASAAELQRAIFPHVCTETIRRRIKEEGLECFRRQKVPYLKPEHIQLRLAWGIDLLLWTVDGWSAVVFSDASKFNVFGADGNRRCWRKRGKALDPHYTQKKVAHGGNSVMVWGCVTHDGVGRLHRIDARLTSAGYVKLLNEELLGSLSDHNIDPRNIFFQRDRDRKQWTKLVQDFLQRNRIDSLPWPACSPDMNIIENVWDQLDRQVRARVPRAKNTKELWRDLREEWSKIPQTYIDHLYDSLPARVQSLVEAKGGSTGF